MLPAILDPLQRTAQQARGQWYDNLFRIDEVLGAKSTPDIGRDHPDFLVLDVKELDKRQSDFVRTLR